jgi:PAS domain S-box-containing protein
MEMIGMVAVEIALIVGLTLILQRLRNLQLTADDRIEEANVKTDQAKVSTFKAVLRTDQAEARAAEARTKTRAAEATTSLLNTCIAHLSDIVLITEADSLDEPGPRIAFVNDAFERMTGYTSAEALGRSPRFLQGPKTDRRVLDEIHQAVAQRKPIRRQIINYHKDGSEFWLDIDIVPIFDAAGRCTHFAGIERDITEEKKTRESLDLFRTLMDRSPDAIEVVDATTGRFLHVNGTAWQRLGYSREEMLSLSIPDVIVAGESPFSMDANVQDIRKTGVKIMETRHRRKDGSTFPIEINTQYIDLDQGYLVAVIRDITERRQAEEVRRIAEERYRTLFDYAPDGILIVSPENIYIDANVSICQMLGYARDELIGLSVRDLVAEKDLPRIDPALSVIRAQTNHHREWDFRRKDGSLLQVDAFSTLMPDGNVLAMIRDITDRKRNDARFRRLVDSNAQSVMFWNARGQITDANDAFLNLLQYTREDLNAGSLIWTLITAPEYADLDRRAMAQISATGACAPYRKEFIRKDGARVSVLIGGADFEDNPEEGVAFMLDLTERERAAEQLAEQAALLDEAQDAIILRDLEGTAIYWNKGAERMYGWSREEVLGVNMSKLLFADPKKYAEVIALTIGQGKWSGDLKNLTKDKREITVEARWTLIRDDQGNPKSVLAINTDITEKKAIEAQFLRAQRMESIGTLAGGIAHDLNNILAPIMMSIDILKLTATDPQAKSILDTIEASSKRGSDIVRQVLSFARGLESQRVEIQPAHLLRELECIIKNTFPKNIRLRFTIPNNIWMILGDPTQVHQILLNLCVNARDAMPKGGNLTIEVGNGGLDAQHAALPAGAKAGRYVYIRVTDSGTGIPQAILDKIFEPFFTTKEVNEGTGLGLSTVMGIVKSHEGVIDVSTDPGRGTTFTVYLPAMEISGESPRPPARTISAPAGKGETVLVVDDEASILTIASQSLEAFGYRVFTATNGAEAMTVYAKHQDEIAVVLTDMSMPIMDGAVLIRALAKINPAVKIIAASGLNANDDLAKMSGASVKHFLKKPYTAEALLEALRKVLTEVVA